MFGLFWGCFGLFWGYFKLFWGYFGSLGAHHQTALCYSLLIRTNTLASPEVDQGTHVLIPEVDQDSRVLHLIYFWGDLLLADLLLGMPVYPQAVYSQSDSVVSNVRCGFLQ